MSNYTYSQCTSCSTANTFGTSSTSITYASSLASSTYSSQTICISGTFYIDVPTFTFNASNVKMASGSSIIVLAGKTLTVTNATNVTSCNQINMWNGITANTGSFVNVQSSSYVSDALTGILAWGTARLDVDNSTFNRCYEGIKFIGVATNTSEVSTSAFTCFQPGTTTPANLLAPHTSTRTLSGITVASTTLPSANALTQLTFENCITGIGGGKSTFSVYDSWFTSCTNGVNIQSQSGTIYVQRNFFRDCTNGITANVGTKRFYATHNVLYHFTYGIRALNLSAQGGECEITGNFFNCNTGPQGGVVLEPYNYNLFGKVAIQVENKIPTTCIAKVLENIVNNSRVGIHFRNAMGTGSASIYNVWASTNVIYMKVPYSAFNPPPGQSAHFKRLGFVDGGIKGILMEGSDWAGTHQNEFSRDFQNNFTNQYTSLEKLYLAGIYVNNTLNTASHAANTANNVANAFYYQGNCSGTSMYCNKMYSCNAGVSIGHSHNPGSGGGGMGGAYITQQFSPSNVYAGLNEWNGNIDPSRRVTGYNNGTGPVPVKWFFLGPYTNSNAMHPDAWATVNPTGIQTVTPAAVTNSVTCPLPNLVDPTVDDREEMFRSIVDNTIVYDQLPEEYMYQSKRYYYQYMSDKPEWLNLGDASDADFQNYYNELQASNMGKFAQVQQLINNGELEPVADLLANIAPENHIEENKIICYTVYLNSFAIEDVEELTPEQYETLLPIALENPTYGGESVFWARAMLNMLDDENMQPRFAKEEASNIQNTGVYPNPVTDKAYLPCNDGVVLVTLFDISGKKIAAESYVASNHVLQINTAALSKGFYSYKIEGEDLFNTGNFIK